MDFEAESGTGQRLAIDALILSEIPFFNRPLTVTSHGSSAWAFSYRIDVCDNAIWESFFMKVSLGDHGRESLKGEFESTAAIHAVVGDFSSKPIGWGSFKQLPGAHYYFCRFHELSDELPEPEEFCKEVANLHLKSEAPNGKFGFHVTTYNGDLPQDNTYTDTWEQFFINGFKHMIKLNIIRGGPWPALEGLEAAMLEKVIPRLLRPLETAGRFIKPALVHGDLWCGNTAVDTSRDRPLIFDPSSFYAHNEYELGNWRPERNKFSRRYFNTYHSYVPKSAPEEDYDDRNALYSLRFNLQAAALFPEVSSFRDSVIDGMKTLVQKYPRGFEEYLGTFQGDAGNGKVKEAVLYALSKGYRHFDTATAYGNEVEVGDAIRESGIPRNEIFITTKLAQTWHEESDVEKALDQSLEALQMDYVPHAYKPGPANTTLRHPNGKPVIDYDMSRRYPETWAAMEKLVYNGKARLIGVSNFNILKLRRLLETAKIPPAVNQVEIHPYLPQSELLAFCRDKQIHLMAHQPLGGRPAVVVNPNASCPGPIFDLDIADIARSYKKSSAQIILSWIVQRNISVIPRSVHEHHILENLDLLHLSNNDMERISNITSLKGEIRYLDPMDHIGFNIFDENADEPI
ncbi:NADP-dependent oxidoreductase domain-containing protein [Aspergillus stella-maris]|uniref:NADP-dependent oxidoreductase domain-containing protein n=1 Tax=Aspergillus stella-maris TaxID=1810926 RepID=UPI003CCD5A49